MTLPTFSVTNWSKHQTSPSREERGTLPWFKLWPRLVDDRVWWEADDLGRLVLIVALMAARHWKNRVEFCPRLIKQFGRLAANTSAIQARLKYLEKSGFISVSYPPGNHEVTTCSARVEESRVEEIRNNPDAKTRIPHGFVRFWEVWQGRHGRKLHKAAALKVWKSLKLEPLADQIVAGVEAEIRERSIVERGGGWFPEPKDPQRWLKGRCWEVEQAAPTPEDDGSQFTSAADAPLRRQQAAFDEVRRRAKEGGET